jgi:transposase
VTPETRADHDRADLRYPSDLTDAEWQLLAPLLPPPAEIGRHRAWPMREMMNAIFFVLRGGCPWRMLPEHFPPHQTAYRLVHPLSRRQNLGTPEPPTGDAGSRACPP